ncbi:DNA cytosine methyltransferase [Vreelandella indica]|uniref:DNA cytosine methyltransferase n=1 Tax=Vreelandella indica TaxID=3126500 RepID=UPI00300E1323
MNYGSVCSGIEAASIAWEPLGWKAQFFSEIEAFPSAVLNHHWPDTPNLGDMTKFKEWPDATIDVLVGGTPCQSFSVAGLRKGLDDPRGNLALTYLAITERHRPRWLVWENVPGVLSSNRGGDFGAFLGGLGKLGYGWAYRILDAQYFGVAQRRRRVFVVGHLGDWRRAAAVLFERHSLSGDSAPSRDARESFASNAGGCIKSPSHWEGGPHPTLSQSHNAGGIGASNQELFSQRGAGIVGQAIAIHPHCIGRAATSGPQGKEYLESGAAYTCDARGVSQAVATIAFSCKDDGRDCTSDLSPTLRAMAGKLPNGGGQLAVTVALRGREGGATAEVGGEVATALRASTGGGDKPHVLATRQVAQTITQNYGKQPDNSDTALGPNLALHDLAVRRLTPIECERLQGFPENHTCIPWRKKNAKDCPDGPRYKAIGNSMAVPVMRWIGERIQAVDSISNPNAAH